MPLVFCPECGHEISDAAIACPNCGRPLQTNPVVEEVVVKRPSARESDIPKWVYIPIAVIGGLAILLLFLFFFRSEDDPNNVNVKVSANQRASETRQTTTQTVPSTDTGTVTVPSTSVPRALARKAGGFSAWVRLPTTGGNTRQHAPTAISMQRVPSRRCVWRATWAASWPRT